jgi:very-short-patch-repair endonuclease
MKFVSPHPDPLPGGERENTERSLEPTWNATTPLSPPGRGAGGEGTAGRYKTRDTRDIDPILQTFAKNMRHAPTDAEGRLWYFLRDRRMAGHKFRRQHAIGHYILDFVCVEAHLVVELDGGQHSEQTGYDDARTRFLESRRLRVLRFWNDEVLKHCEDVLQCIWQALAESATPHPGPLPGGERENTSSHVLALEAASTPLSPPGRGAGGEGKPPATPMHGQTQ